MAYFFIPYALGDFSYQNFKEISKDEYFRLNTLIKELAHLNSMKFTGEESVYALEQNAYNAAMEIHKNIDVSYKQAKQELAEFERRYRDVFYEGESLRDDDTIRFLWIFDISSREKDLKRHNEKYKHLYDKRNALQHKVHGLQPYLKENIKKTIEQKKWEATYKIKENNERKKREWEQNQRIKLNNLEASLGEAAKYAYICSNLSVTVEQSACTVKCDLTHIRNTRTITKEYINRTFINKHVQIIR
ncbi:MAG: hypothetical protein ACLRFK_03165 [Alphaproteobacteria bacterium]